MAAAAALGALALAISVGAAASAPPTITITTTVREVQGSAAFPVSGAVASARAGEDVSIEVKDCGSYAPFHQTAGAQTVASGAWTAQVGMLGSGQLRARWRGGVSDPISIQVHPFMTLTYKGPSRYFLWIRANDFFGGARAVLERLAGDKWVAVKKFTVHRADSAGVASSQATVRAKLKKGTIIRAVLPKAQAGRCYLAGFTNTLKV